MRPLVRGCFPVRTGSAMSVLSLPSDFPNDLLFSLVSFVVRTHDRIHVVYKASVHRLLLASRLTSGQV